MLINIDSERNCPCEFARKSYTLKHKLTTVRVVEGFLSTGVKINEACSLCVCRKACFLQVEKTLGLLKNGADNTTVGVVADMPVEDEATLENAVIPPFVVPPAVVPMTVVKLNTGHARSLNTG